MKTYRGQRYLTATELADLGRCERQAMYQHWGHKPSAPDGGRRAQAKHRGDMEHERRYRELTQPKLMPDRSSHQASHQPSRQPMGGPADRRCFIATAVYGPDAWQTNRLRHWRDQTMMPSRLGRCLIRTYYAISPSVARRLDSSVRLQRMARALLNGFVGRLD